MLPAVLLSACATILIPQNQTVVLNTDHDSASVMINKMPAGNGKQVPVRVQRGVQKDVTIERPGYKPQHEALLPNHRSLAFSIYQPLNVLNCFIGIIYDFTIDKNVDFPHEFYFRKEPHLLVYHQADSQKYLKTGEVSLLGNVPAMEYAFIQVKYPEEYADLEQALKDAKKARQDLLASGKPLPKTQKFYLKGDYDVYLLGSQLREAIAETHFSADSIPTVRDWNNIYELSARVDFAELYDIRGKRWRHHMNRVNMGITWYFFNRYGECVDSIETEAASGDFVMEPNLLMRNVYGCAKDALYANYLELLRSERFGRIMAINTFNAPEFPELTLAKPKRKMGKKADALKACVTIGSPDGYGSGFAITEDGYILASYHVVASRVTDSFSGLFLIDHRGEKKPISVVRFSKQHDLVLLKADHSFEYAFDIADTSKTEPGTPVYTIGTPASVELGQTVTAGTVSGIHDLNGLRTVRLKMRLNDENSGGPVMDDTMRLLGMINIRMTDQTDNEGDCLAIPAETLSKSLQVVYKAN